MKKILASLLVLAMCAPLYAGEVTLSSVDNADGTATIMMEVISGEPVGIALDVLADTGTIDDAFMVDSFFDIFIDLAYDEELGGDGYTYGEGTNAIAKVGEPGQDTVATNPFCISAGGLGGEEAPLTPGPQPLDTVALIQLDSAGGATGTITANAIRGGAVVFKDGSTATVNGLPLDFEITTGPGECVKSDAGFYDTWELFGKPDCWCYPRNCRGDVDNLKSGIGVNKKWVNSVDLGVFAAAFNLIEADLNALSVGGVPGICADNDRLKSGIGVNKKWVNSADLGRFADYFNLVEADVPVCDMSNYNFFINP